MRKFMILYILNGTTLETREIECDRYEFLNELIIFSGVRDPENRGGILLPKQPKIILAIPVKNLVSIEEL